MLARLSRFWEMFLRVFRRTRLFCDGSVESFEDDRHKITALGAFDLLERLDVVVLGPVHDGEDLGGEAGLVARPAAA